MSYILASASPRRKELLKKVISDFSIIVPDVEETETGDPEKVALQNAYLKAAAVEGETVIGCDTVVALDGEIFGKPGTPEKAAEMLTKLSAKTHKVISGLCIKHKNLFFSVAVTSFVTFYPLTNDEILRYIEEYSPLDKAGAYGIQDGVVVKEYSGSYDNIVGLPTEVLSALLKKHNI